METQENMNITLFKIVFNDQLIELNYDPSFEEYKTITIKSVIEKVLEKIGPKPQTTTSDNYVLLCSCGKSFNPDKLISNSKCDHYTIFKDQSKNKNEKFLLIEKSNKEQINKEISDKNDLLTNFEISQILKQVTGAKRITPLKVVPESKNVNFPISENLKKVIKELIEKKQRGEKMLQNDYDLKYDQNLYNELLTFGIEEKKIKAALRMTNNIKEEALLLATDPTFNIENRDYLYCDNDQVLTNHEFMRKCKEEVKKEYSNLFPEEITARTKMVIKIVSKKNDNDNNEGEELFQSSEIVENSSIQNSEEAEEDNAHYDISESEEHSSEI
jgi:hypothetical protein